MLEAILGLGIVALIFAYLYTSQEKQNFAMRLFFLSISLFSISLLGWLMFNSASTMTSYQYDATGALIGSSVYNVTQSANVQTTLITFYSILIIIPILVIAVALLIFFWNLVAGFLENRKEEII